MKTGTYIILTLSLSAALLSCAQGDKSKQQEKNTVMNNSNIDTATFGAGCFWCVEAIYQQLEGVVSVTSGFSGGKVANPTYEAVCTGSTGHDEVCNIVYDTTKISFEELLEVFWSVHDPTTPNRQGHDVGTQYRSAIFYHNDHQKELAEKYKADLDKSGAWKDPLVTEITPFTAFYSAEKYHQNYYNDNSGKNPYCSIVIAPKMEKFKKVFANKLKHTK